MQNGQKTISELFDGRKIFNIPKYQRAYAWEEKQLKDFVEDIENQNPDKDYFFGTILLQEQQRRERFEMIDIVDGQQRITTLIIFMKLLLARCGEIDNDVTMLENTYIRVHNRYKLRILETDNDFFTSYILQDNQPIDNQVHTPSQSRLIKAKNFLAQWLEEHLDKIDDFIEKIESMKVLTYSVEDDAEAALIFETTNDRGKPLTSLEKTKSFLMHKTYIASDNSEADMETLQSRFSEIYRDYEKIESCIDVDVDEDSILQYHFIAFEKWSSTRSNREYQHPVQTIKQKVNILINENRAAEAMSFIDRYSLELTQSFEIMRRLSLDRDPHLLDIRALNRPAAFYPILIKAYKLDTSDGKQNFKRVAQLVEIICFRFGIAKSRSNTGVTQLYRLARDFNGDFEQLISDFQDFVEWYCNDSDFRQRLLTPRFYDVVNRSDQRYLFWKYENHLRATEKPISSEMSHDEFANDDPRTKFTIEHIIPQNPKDSEKVDVDDSMLSITDFEDNYLHCIGNLVLDSRSANASKSNQDFETKDEQYSKAPIKLQLALSRFCNPKPDRWNHISISDRGDKIVKFALERWNHRKPGRKSAEIDEKIRLDEGMEKIFKEVLSTEEPVQ